jgi:hypothetical protein
MQLFFYSCGFLNDLREVKPVPTSRESQFYFKMTSLHPFMTFFSLFSLYCEEQDFVTFKKKNHRGSSFCQRIMPYEKAEP